MKKLPLRVFPIFFVLLGVFLGVYYGLSVYQNRPIPLKKKQTLTGDYQISNVSVYYNDGKRKHDVLTKFETERQHELTGKTMFLKITPNQSVFVDMTNSSTNAQTLNYETTKVYKDGKGGINKWYSESDIYVTKYNDMTYQMVFDWSRETKYTSRMQSQATLLTTYYDCYYQGYDYDSITFKFQLIKKIVR